MLLVKRDDNWSVNIDRECLWGSSNRKINTNLDLLLPRIQKGKFQDELFLNDRFNRERYKKLLSYGEKDCYLNAQCDTTWKKIYVKYNIHASSRKVFWQRDVLSVVKRPSRHERTELYSKGTCVAIINDCPLLNAV